MCSPSKLLLLLVLYHLSFHKEVNATNLTILVTTKEYEFENVTEKLIVNSRVDNKILSSKVILLRRINNNLWKYVPPVSMVIGVTGNGITIAIMRR